MTRIRNMHTKMTIASYLDLGESETGASQKGDVCIV